MNKLLPVILGSLVLSTSTVATAEILVMDDDVDTIQVQSKEDLPSFKVPKRTSFFTGMEYAESVSDTRASAENIKFTLADGSTRIHPNFRLRYALSQSKSTTGIQQDTSARRTNVVIAPRYEQWVNHRFSFFAEPVYVHQSRPDNGNTTELKFRPGAQFTYGKNYLSTTFTYARKKIETYLGTTQTKETEFDTFEMKANYTYRYNAQANFGLELTRNGNIDNSDPLQRRRAFAIKPSVRLKHWKGIVSEVSVPYNYNESNVKLAGTETVKINFNNNYPFNKHVKVVANVGYEMIKFHEAGLYYGEDKEGITAKLGLSLGF